MKNSLCSSKLFFSLFVISLSFLLSSCDKQEGIEPSIAPLTPENKIVPVPVVPEFLLRIDHISHGAVSYDYSIMLWNDGTVQFDGRFYVPYPGIQYASISLQDVDFIRNMYQSALFGYQPSSTPIELLPYVKTTFSGNAMALSIIDLNNGSPMMILKMREKAEEIMGINNFLNGRRPKSIQNIN